MSKEELRREVDEFCTERTRKGLHCRDCPANNTRLCCSGAYWETKTVKQIRQDIKKIKAGITNQPYSAESIEQSLERRKEKSRNYYQQNKEKIRQYQKEYRKKNPERDAKYKKDYYKRTKEAQKEYAKKHYRELKEKKQ
jgi:hypothetical protein